MLEFERGDSLRAYLTGASVDGGAQDNPQASFGKYRSSTLAASLGFLVKTQIGGIRINEIAGSMPLGAASLRAVNADTLVLVDANGQVGEQEIIANGETRLVVGYDESYWVSVTRTSNLPLRSSMLMEIVEQIGNVWSGDLVSSASAASGETNYRTICFKNHSPATIQSIKVWLSPLADSVLLHDDGYATDDVYVKCEDGSSFDGWPESGYLENDTTGEVLYYSSRNRTRLIVPSQGRDIWDETSGGQGVGDVGLAGDQLTPIPGFRIALENPSVQPDGTFQATANELARPAGLTWSHAHGEFELAVPTRASLLSGRILGLWLERRIPAGAVAVPVARNIVSWAFNVNT